jgi:RNA polymerase sigma factor (sigma-70 family)
MYTELRAGVRATELLRVPSVAAQSIGAAPGVLRDVPTAEHEVVPGCMQSGCDIDLDAVLAGSAAAIHKFVVTLTPVIQSRVARGVLQHSSRDVRQDVQDFCQDVFMHLFADNGHVLRRFDARRGLSLPNYVGMIAQRRGVSALRSSRYNAWREDTEFDERTAPGPGSDDPAGHACDEDQIATLFEALQRTLSPMAWHLFQLLYVHELSVDEAMSRTGLTSSAIYAWRSRLRKAARDAQARLKPVSESP